MSSGYYRLGANVPGKVLPHTGVLPLADAVSDLAIVRDVLDAAPAPEETREIMGFFEPVALQTGVAVVKPLPFGEGAVMVDPAFSPGPAKLDRGLAIQMGYTGDTCTHCGGSRMKHTGHCNTCEECGTTTGCS